ncbi:hypothetical protein, partial [uncultured Halomonas sp.]|uniref:hypothetical protein n=1 Tax=uncultured Halomonas sp. TaxID=173971 RepID=UPI003458048B
MLIRITRPGIYRNGTTQIPVGTELEVPDDFRGWQNKWVRVDSPRATLEVASPAPAEEPDAELEEARAEYEAAFGEKPHARMKAETIRRKLE